VRSEILQRVDAVFPEVVQIRRFLHENPEISSKEFHTSRYLKEYSQRLGLEIESVPPAGQSAGTGFIAILDTKRPGKTIGLRTDIDALPIPESKVNLAGEKAAVSRRDGAMHACGHDGHMAILLGTMNILASLREHLNGKFLFIFEEGEETGSGIHPMVERLKRKAPDVIYGNHLVSFLNTGEIAASPGPVTSSTARVKMKVIGRGGHASRPDRCINPIFAGAAILNSLAIAWSNQLDVTKTITFGITQFHAGEARNVIPEEAYIGGTLRYFDREMGEAASDLIRRIAADVARAHRCRMEFYPDFGPSTPSVINDGELSNLVRDVVRELYPGAWKDNVRWFASETFSRYRQICPTVFSFVGIRNEKVGSGAEHHNPHFDLDEESLKYAIGTMSGFAIKMSGLNRQI